MKKNTLLILFGLICCISTLHAQEATSFTDADLSLLGSIQSKTVQNQQSNIIPVQTNLVTSTFTSRTAFQAACAGLPLEDFTGGPGPGGIVGCTNISSAGSTCYPAGEIIPGFILTASEGGNIVALGSGYTTNTSTAVGADLFAQFSVITFSDPNVTSVGMDILSFVGNTDFRVFDSGGVLTDTFTLVNPAYSENFFGVITDVPIGKIEIEAASDGAELFENLEFGSCTTATNTPPTAICQNITVQLDATGSITINAAQVDNGSSDVEGPVTLSIDIDTFDCSNIGPNTVTLTVTDSDNDTTTCTATVTVNDTELPEAVCQAITVQLDANGTVSIVAADVDGGSTDNCGVDTVTIDIDTFDCSNVGDNNVTLTVTDVNGNVSDCIAVVTVEDTIAPAIACPADVMANTNPGDCSAIVSFANPVALDNCGIATVIQTAGLASGSAFPVGVSIVEFTATDVNGNAANCSFNITVTDNEAPMAICQPITIQLDEFGNASITAADVDGGSTDQCGVASMAIDMDTFDCSNVGDNDVILTVTDVNGNVSDCTAVVTVEDGTAPVVSCQSITVELDANGTVTITGADIDNGSTDACGIASYDLDMETFDCSNIGENTVILTVTDVNGNSDTCSAIVTVEDNIAPVLVCQDFTIEIGADGTATLDPNDVIASNDDACGIFTVAVDVTAFSCADIGTPVTVQVFTEDNNGNLATCMATITAVDLLAPVVTCPANQTVDPGAGNLFYILPDYFATGEATAIDNCTDPVTITSQSPVAGTELPDGIHTITLTGTDEYGNIGMCSFELTVESVLGVGDNNQELGGISMYPNPAQNTVTIDNSQQLELVEAGVYDLTGRLVLHIDLKNMGIMKTITIDHLSSAAYMVIIKGKSGQIIKRLIKE